MAIQLPQHPCPWCHGRDFVVHENVWLEITDYGRRFNAVSCKTCGHTAFFTLDPPQGGTPVRVEPTDGGGPYR